MFLFTTKECHLNTFINKLSFFLQKIATKLNPENKRIMEISSVLIKFKRVCGGG